MSTTRRWLSGIALVVGAWVFASAFVLDIAGGHYWNNIVVGAAIFVLSGYSALRDMEDEAPSTWTSGLSALLGLWMIATPFVYGYANQTVLASGVVSGVIVAVLEGYNAYTASMETREMARRAGA